MQECRWKVYVHINKTNGKRYVGITSLDVNNRWRDGNGYKTQVLGRAIAKYGWDGFDHIIVEDNLTMEEANKLERQLISEWHTQDPEHGYNVADGGDGVSGFKFSDESRAKMSESAKHRNICYANRKQHPPISELTRKKMSTNNTGTNNPNYGRKHTDAELLKMSASHSKRVVMIGENDECIRMFSSATEAANHIGVCRTSVAKCCRGLINTCKGFKFQYV